MERHQVRINVACDYSEFAKARFPRKDLTKEYPHSPRDLLAGYIIGAPTLDKCRAFLNNSIGEYHFDCPLDNMFFSFTWISSEQFKEIVSTGADDEEIAAWVGKHGKPRERIEIIRWNNDLRYKRLSELPDGMQEYMEDYIPQFVPPHLRHHIDYFFDVYVPKKNGWKPDSA